MPFGFLGAGFGRLGAATAAGAGGGAAAAAYSYRGSSDGSSGGVAVDTVNYTIDIGTASADRLIVVATGVQGAKALTGLTVAGTPLTIDVQNAGQQSAIASGLVTSGSGSQTISATWTGSGFNVRKIMVWAVTGLQSNTVRATGSGATANTSISVTATDFLFATTWNVAGTGSNFGASTESPAASRFLSDGTFTISSADWTILATNASFNINAVVTSLQAVAAATYR
jgi:hypothetical protein